MYQEEEIRNLIERLESIKESQRALSREEFNLSKATYNDYSQISTIYDTFPEGRTHSAFLKRKKFLFVVLLLYSPAALAGGRMRRGLREVIAVTVGCSCSNVSHDYQNVWFYYTSYKKFREDVKDALELIERTIPCSEEGL
jgi:hypothetical protein